MKLKDYFNWLLPHKFYGGGGGSGTKQSPEQAALQKISQEKWDEYKKTYVPVENNWMKKVQGLNDSQYHNQAQGMASVGVKQSVGSQVPAMQQGMQGQRVGGATDYIPQANAVAGAVSDANQGVTDRYLKGKAGIIALGQGQGAEAIEGLGKVANTAVSGRISANENRFNNTQDNLGMVGTVAGGGFAGLAHAKKN